MTDLQTPKLVLRPRLALWMWERNLRPADGVEPLEVSAESVRRYCLPFGHPDRQIPTLPVLDRIFTWTAGEITPEHFYPARLTQPCEAIEEARS